MEFRAAIRARHMVRSFSDQPIEQSEILELLDDSRRAPSAGNTQATEFVVLATPSAVRSYWATTMAPEKQESFRWQGLLNAPALVMVLTRPGAYLDRYAEHDKASTGRGDAATQWPVPYWWVDAGCVIQNLLLSATNRNLGACFFGPFDHEPALRTFFGIPTDRRIVATVALGHPQPGDTAPTELGRSARRKRAPVEDLVHWGDWSPS